MIVLVFVVAADFCFRVEIGVKLQKGKVHGNRNANYDGFHHTPTSHSSQSFIDNLHVYYYCIYKIKICICDLGLCTKMGKILYQVV